MNRQCVNCPGATDHDTAHCPKFQAALIAANEIADQFGPGFFDDRMVRDVAAIIEKHCRAEQPQASAAQSAPAGEREAFEAYRDERNAALEAEGHKPGSKWHVTQAHNQTWEAGAAWQRTQSAGVPAIPQQWAKSLAHCWPEDSEDRNGDWCVGTIDEDGNFYEVVKVEASQYDAAGESQKIAEAIVALWAYAAAPAQPAAQEGEEK